MERADSVIQPATKIVRVNPSVENHRLLNRQLRPGNASGNRKTFRARRTRHFGCETTRF